MFPTFKTRDEIPEQFRDNYEERDGEWHPVVPDNSAALQRALDAERERANKEERDRKAAEQRETNLRRTGTAKDKGVTEEQLSELRAEDERRRQADLAPVQEENRKLKEKLRTVLHTDRVKMMGLEAGIMQDRIDDAMLVLVHGPTPRTGLTEDGDTIVVKDKKGNPTAQKIEDFLANTLPDEKPWLYGGTGSSGSGAGSLSTRKNIDQAREIPPARTDNGRADEHRTMIAANI